MNMNPMSPNDYPVVVHRRAARFVLEAPALAVIAEGPDLGETEAALRTRIGDVLRGYATAALPPPPPDAGGSLAGAAPVGRPAGGSRRRTLTIAGIVLALVMAGSVYGAASAVQAIRSAVDNSVTAAREAARQALSPRVFSDTLIGTVDLLQQITPERRELIVQQLGVLAEELEPFVAQLRPPFAGESVRLDATGAAPSETRADGRTNPGASASGEGN